MKYNNLAVVTKQNGDYKTLGFVSSNSIASIKRTVKADKNYNYRNNGIIEICFDDMESIKMNSNKF
jgi:hypothetical protein